MESLLFAISEWRDDTEGMWTKQRNALQPSQVLCSPVPAYTHEVITLWYRAPELLLGAQVYSTAVDMWSCGCILGEMLSKNPILNGEGEIDQVTKICRLIGTPSEEIWPGFSKLPNANLINMRSATKSRLRDQFPVSSFSGGVFLPEAGFDLLSRLLWLDPSRRLSSTDALHHRWFEEFPAPCAMDMMPQFTSRHEKNNAGGEN
jgi:cell division cycle 2-like protein